MCSHAPRLCPPSLNARFSIDQSNKPVMGIVQDSLLASAQMTKRDVFIERDVLFNILMWVENFDGRVPAPAILKPKALWTGKQVFSLITPKVNYRGSGNTHPKAGVANTLNGFDSAVLIHEGNIVMGIIDKKTLGTSGGSLIHTSWPVPCAVFDMPAL